MKTKPMILAMLLFIMSCAVSAYAANFSMEMDGYYGGTLSMNGNYEIVNSNATTLDPDMNITMTYQYNNFSIIPSISFQEGTITTVNTCSSSNDSMTITGNFSVLIGGTSYNFECHCQINDEDGDDEYITPDSYIKINNISYPVSWDLWDIISDLGMLIE